MFKILKTCTRTLRRFWAPLTASAVLVPQSASAADPPLTPTPVEVTVSAAPNEVSSSGSRASTTVSEEQIRDVLPGSLADALRMQSGVAVQQTTPGQGTIYVRGLSSREVLHLVDGVPINATIFRAGNNPYLGLVDPYSVRKIDIVRGAASVVHGSDALGGVVSLTTALPGYSAVAGGTTRVRLFQGFTLSPLGSTSRVSAEHSAARLAAYVGVSHYQAGDIRPGGGFLTPQAGAYHGLERLPGSLYHPALSGVQQGTAFQMYSANAAMRARLTRRSEIVFRTQFGFRPELQRYDEVMPLFKNERPTRAESSTEPFYRAMNSIVLAHRGGGEGSVYRGASAQLAWQRLHESIQRRGLSETCIADDGAAEDHDTCVGVLRLNPAKSIDRESNRSDALSLRAESRFGGRAWALRLGVDGSHDIVTSRSERLNLTTLEVLPQPERFPTGSSQTQAGLFAMVEVNFVQRLHVHAGIRGTLFHLAIRTRETADPTPSPAFSRTVFDAAFNAGVRLDITPEASLVINAGRGVRAPNVQDFSGLGARARGRFQIPNPDIAPEHTISLDSGIRFSRGKLRAETYVFHLRYTDAIALAPTTVNGATVNASGERYERTENAALVEYYGLETSLRIPFTSFVGINAEVLAMMGIQYNDPKLGLPEKTPADRTPPPTLTLGLWVEPSQKLRLEGIAYARLAQQRLNNPTNLDDNRIPEGGTPGFVSLRVQGIWRARQNVHMRIAFDNLTDSLILEHGSGFYRPGINAAASVEVSF